jgi:hypothetical protein
MSPSDGKKSSTTPRRDDRASPLADRLRLALTPPGLSGIAAVVAAVVLYFWQGRATALLGSGLVFFVAWVITHVLVGLPEPTLAEQPRSGEP